MQKKKNWPMKLGIAFAVLFCLWAILRFTNTLQYYSVPTSGNSPTINTGDIIWTSRFKTLQRGDFMAFKTYDSSVGGMATWVKRCVGMPSDTVEMKNGILFVNGKNVDENYTLSTDYAIVTHDAQKIYDSLNLSDHDNNQNTLTEFTLKLSLKEYKKVQSLLTPGQDSIKQILFSNNNDDFQPTFFAKLKKNNWTLDNFGPLTVPYNHYFVLGDNRHGSQDSRFIGFIKKENFVGTILGR